MSDDPLGGIESAETDPPKLGRHPRVVRWLMTVGILPARR